MITGEDAQLQLQEPWNSWQAHEPGNTEVADAVAVHGGK